MQTITHDHTSSKWSHRPAQADHRIHIGRFKRLVLLVFGIEGLFLALSIALNELTYFIVGAAGVLGAYFLWVRMRRAKDAHTNREAVRLLGAGEFDEAIRLFDQLCQNPTNGSTLAVFLMNRGTASLCRGEFDVALSIYHEVLRAERGIARSVFKLHGDLFRARCAEGLAVYGDLDAAEAMLAIHKTHDAQARAGMQLLARTVIALRRGERQAAWTHLTTHWASAEAMQTATELKALLILRAFTAEHADPICSSITAHDLTRNRWLGTNWSEMFDFIENFDSHQTVKK